MNRIQRNEERGLRAYETISLYKERYLGEDGPVNGDEDIVDLLTDIRHFCKQQGIKFSRLVSISYSHFKVETEREE